MAKAVNLGFSRIGANRQLKKALETFWAGKSSRGDLLAAAKQIRRDNWAMQSAAGIDEIPSGDFSLYDHVLDTAITFGVIPSRFRIAALSSDLDRYFAMARGMASQQPIGALEMTKWFDTNYHYLVPEFSAGQEFSLAQPLAVQAYQEARTLGHETRPVILGPVSFLTLGKTHSADFSTLSLLDGLLPAYEELLRQLQAAGARWVQIDEPVLVFDADPGIQRSITAAITRLANAAPGLKILLASYFGGLGDNLDTVLRLPVHALQLDLVRAPEQLDSVIRKAPRNLALSLGLVDGRNIWKADLAKALETAGRAADALTPDRIFIAPSCSLLHVPVDLAGETALPAEIKDWLAFGKQKLDEVAILARALNEGREAVREALEENAASMRRRKESGLVLKQDVRKRVAGIDAARDGSRTPFSERNPKQQAILQLPLFPTTTIGSFPQTPELRRRRAQMRKGEITAAEYDGHIREEIAHAIAEQERIGIDVLVHGEAERNDMVEYFGELLDGFAFTGNGWVQSYGSRCVKPPVIYGDVTRRAPMTVEWWRFAQSRTRLPMKGMLTGPVTILQWSFVRNDQPRRDTCRQLALAIRDETRDLEAAGCKIIQIDEPAFREGLPLRKSDAPEYLRWAVDCFRLASSGVRESTQIHTHMCYAEFNEIIDAIAEMDADVISLESARSQMELLDAFAAHAYRNDIGPGVYDIHSPRVPSAEEMVALLERALQVIDARRLWVNPDCGLKTRTWEQVTPALENMVVAAGRLRVTAQVNRSAV
jgi:5-methyltetrahydropteroyltriglutamate--homocysteine methyltransferase